MLWFLGNFQYFTIPIGFVGPSLGLSLGWSILAGVLGIAVGTLFMAFHATQGPIFGLPQMIQTRAQLGYRGVVVALFAVLFTYMAFNVADQVLMSTGLHGAFGWNAGLVAIATAVLAALLAIFGYDWVHRVFRFLLVISLPCYAIISVAILIGHAGGTAPQHPGGFLFAAFMAQFSVAAAYNITYAPYVSDYSRYMPRDTSPRGIITAVFFGASGSAVWLIALGAWLATRLGVTDGLVGLQVVGDKVAAPLGSITAVLSATALLATMGMNAYGGMLTVLTGIDSFKHGQDQPGLAGGDHHRAGHHLVRDRRGHLHQRGVRGAELADPDAVPARPVDRAQPGRLLLRPARALRDHRHLPARRRLRRGGAGAA